MSTTYDEVFRVLGKALMLLNNKGKITYVDEDEESGKETKTTMDIATYVLREFAETLVDGGADLSGVELEEDIRPTGNPHHIFFSHMGGRRKTLRRRG